jgi:Fe-S-cluster containining protein
MQKTEGLFHLKQPDNHCPFLTSRGCGIYQARPAQCRTWPFWAENMKERVWKEEIVPCCKGVGKGRLYSPEEITALVRLNTF